MGEEVQPTNRIYCVKRPERNEIKRECNVAERLEGVRSRKKEIVNKKARNYLQKDKQTPIQQ